MNPVPSVVELIAKRIRERSEPGKRLDNYKVALVIEGGVMRGVVSGGMVTALQAMNALLSFDAVFASSAGAFAACCFEGYETPFETSNYYTLLNTNKFINYWRFLKREPMFDIDYVRQVIEEKNLHWDLFFKSNVPLFIAVTDMLKAKTVYFSDFKTKKDVLDSACFSSFIPAFAGEPIEKDGVYYADGGIFAPVPIEKPIKDGFTHILVLLTRPDGVMPHKGSLGEWFFERLLKKKFPLFVEQYKRRHLQVYREALKMIEDSESNPNVLPLICGVRISSSSREIKRTEKNAQVLRQGAVDGYEVVLNLFKDQGLEIDSRIHVI